jgi:hypothetical protein
MPNPPLCSLLLCELCVRLLENKMIREKYNNKLLSSLLNCNTINMRNFLRQELFKLSIHRAWLYNHVCDNLSDGNHWKSQWR